MRTLLKEGRTEALRLFNYSDPDQIREVQLNLGQKEIPIGSDTYFEAGFNNNDPNHVRLRLEYAILYRKSKGGLSKKVFQIAEKNYETGDHRVRRKLSFKDMSTRKHYPGEHILAFIINGKEVARLSFSLLPA